MSQVRAVLEFLDTFRKPLNAGCDHNYKKLKRILKKGRTTDDKKANRIPELPSRI